MESQKNAVVRLVKARLGSLYSPTEPSQDKLTKDDIETIRQEIVSGIEKGQIEFKSSKTGSALSRYVIGMITNHLRKTKELNGGLKRSQVPTKPKAQTVKVNGTTVDTSVLPDELARELQQE